MKKWICALCALALALLPAAAFAAEGDAILAHGDDMYVNRILAIGDTLYLDNYSSLLTFRAGEAQTKEYNWNRDFSAYDQESSYSGDSTLLERDGELWSLDQLMDYEQSSRIAKTLLSRVVLGEDGTASLADTQELEWPAELIERYDSNEYPKTLRSACIRGNTLYAVTYDQMLYGLDLESGQVENVNVDSVDLFVPYTNGTFLLAGYDYSAGNVALTVFDPASGSAQPLVTTQMGVVEGLAADPQSGAVYGLKDGGICPLDLTSGELGDSLTDMPLSSSNDSNGWILSGQYYALCCEGGVVVRNLQPESRPERSLRIYDGAWTDSLTDAYFDFTNTHSDVAVSISRNGSSNVNLIEDMMNRNGDIDIFVLQTSMSEYDALFERGFLAELDSEKLNKRMENVYPAVKERLTRDGKLVALPVNCYYWPMTINIRALEKLGLSAEDVPTNWSDFLDFLIDTLPKYMTADCGVQLLWDGITVESVRSQICDLIFTDYQNYANTMMDVPSYDTPILKELLEKLNRVDFEALGVPKGEEDDSAGGVMVYSVSGDDSTLLNIGNGASFGNFSDKYNLPIVMSLSADTPAIMSLEVYVAVINPFSDEAALAQEFLECLADQLPETLMYNLDPTLNEPVLRKDSGDYTKYAQENYDDVKKRYDEADAVDKQALEEELKSAEEWLENAEEYKWLVSQSQIDWFRANDDNVVCQPVNWLYRDSTGEAYELMQQYMNGQIDVSQFLKGIDKKVRMMMMEGN